MTKPRVDLHHPATADDGPNERTLQVVFENGAGCLIHLRSLEGVNTIDIYRADDGIFVLHSDNCGAEQYWKVRAKNERA